MTWAKVRDRYVILGPAIGVWISQLVVIAAVGMASQDPFSDSGQVYDAVAFCAEIIAWALLALALATCAQLPVRRDEAAAVLTTVIPTVSAIALALWLLIPPSP